MSNTPKPKDDDCRIEANLLHNAFVNASNQIDKADIAIEHALGIIRQQDLIRSKAKLIKNIITWQATISDIVPTMPKSWKNNPKLETRYNNLIQVIQNNPQWWIEWKDKIEIKDEWIDFKTLNFILDLDDLPEKKNWYDLEKWDDLKKENMMDSIPEIKDFRVISNFINSSWNENRKSLTDFLGLNADFYWSSTAFNRERALKIWFKKYVQDNIDDKNNYLSIRTIQKY